MPQATCDGSDSSTALFWVGIDGYPETNGTVEQIGTFVQCVAGLTTPEHGAWYEFSPLGRVNLDPKVFPVSPNDKIFAEERYNPNSNHFHGNDSGLYGCESELENERRLPD